MYLNLVNARPMESHVRRTHQLESPLVTGRFCVCLARICPGRIGVALLSRATIRPFVEDMSSFFIKMKCFPKTFQNVPERGPLATEWKPLANIQKRLEK